MPLQHLECRCDGAKIFVVCCEVSFPPMSEGGRPGRANSPSAAAASPAAQGSSVYRECGQSVSSRQGGAWLSTHGTADHRISGLLG